MSFIRIIAVALCIVVIGQYSGAATVARENNPQTDLYRVYIHNQADAELLAKLPIDPLLRLDDGYLVLISPSAVGSLASGGPKYELVAAGLGRDDLALDIRHDRSNIGRYPLVFEENGIRIFRTPSPGYLKSTRGTGLAPIRTENMPITYRPVAHLDKSLMYSPDSLADIVDAVSQDSIIAFSEQFQSYDGRVVGSGKNYQSAMWTVGKFESWGYDSVVVDTFTAVIDGEPTLCRNVIAYKLGTEYPHDHVIVGGHRDAVEMSPGADDNGSGSVGVLEIARAFADIDTRTTIVFILFDAEEAGLLGSWHYANRSAVTSERIAVMFNMDMIGYYENTDQAYISGAYEGDPYASLWASLADSIPSIAITGQILVTQGRSDHFPFQQRGYNVANSHEYIFSTVYHSVQDSTAYLSYDYMTRMIKATAATAYVSDQQYAPAYELYVAAMEPLPQLIYPQTSTPIEILVREYGGAQLISGSVYLHYAVNGGEDTTIPMAYAGSDIYEAALPPFDCLDVVDYYVTAEDDSLGDMFYPGEGETVAAMAATKTYDVFKDYFETDQGWTIVSETYIGDWYRYQSPSDYDGNRFFYLAAGPMGVHIGTTSLISPLIDIDGTNCVLEYARWCAGLYPTGPTPDYLTVYIRNAGGGPWIPIESITAYDSTANEWELVRFRISDFLTPPETIQLKFDATENGDDAYMYAAVDAVSLIGFGTDTRILTESVPSWTAYLPYSRQLDAASCAAPISWADHFGQLEGTGLTLSEDGLLSGIPARLGPVVFRALVTDQFGSYDEQVLSLIIYDTLHVTTSTIPAAAIGESYSSQLRVSGGTGTRIWADRDDDLDGSGVTLSGSGLLSGTPAVEGDFPFTVLVTDQVGATTEKAFTLHIVSPYVCGDADGDSAVDISDAVYVINYIFKSGASPYPLEAGDANADGSVDVGDAVYLIEFIFKSGSAPQCP